MSSNTVIRQLQVVFSISIALLIVSLVASYYSTQKLIDNSQLVNHTNEVLLEAENIISLMKDAETGQRGYIITRNTSFLQPYEGAAEKVADSYASLKRLTADNPAQQRNLEDAKGFADEKFRQMRRVIDVTRKMGSTASDTALHHAEMVKGKEVMDALRGTVNRIKIEETRILKERIEQQDIYIRFTPVLLVLAALLSIVITISSYVRIKKDLDERIAKQKRDEAEYRETTRRIGVTEDLTRRIAAGDYSARSADDKDDDLGRISKGLNSMAEALEKNFTDLENRNWLQTGTVQLADAMRGTRDLKNTSVAVLETLVSYLSASAGTLYTWNDNDTFELQASLGAVEPPKQVVTGVGLAGHAIRSGKVQVVSNVPENYLTIQSSLGTGAPASLVFIPLLYGGGCIGLVELGLFRKVDARDREFFDHNRESLAIGLNSAMDYLRLQHFLEETQAQSEELQAQHNELENLNAELEAQAQKLQASEEELRVQQEELLQTNTELEERGLLLEQRNDEIARKAGELELTTRYKSEFLANMSHELRTPLNSILLLSRLLSENLEQNLTGDQVEYARVIQSSGTGLLALIDEILDLSKIEAGQMKLEFETFRLLELTEEIQSLFSPVAREKQLEFEISIQDDVRAEFESDRMRLGQILKNLLSNAFKFTAEGSVRLDIRREGLDRLVFSVKDTGIGIPPEKQQLIFEAFQQADGSTKRKYGGTGLGLSISREIARLLGGELTVTSVVNLGSEFRLLLPLSAEVPAAVAETPPAPRRYISTSIPESIPDDRASIVSGDKVILIVEDDTSFARSLLDYARKQGYKGIVAVRGDEGLELAGQYRPMGILLDIQLPVMSGWEVMDALKNNPQTRPIPVHIMSSHKLKTESLQKGAVDFVDKPVAFEQLTEVFRKIEFVLNRESKKVLIVEDNPRHAKALAYFLETFQIHSELKSTLSDSVEALQQKEVDCVILDMGIPDTRSYETLEAIKKNPGLEGLPIIIFTGKSLSMVEELKIRKYADSIVVKTAHSYQRMLDEVSLFLHLVEENRQAPVSPELRRLGALEDVLRDKTVLIADDDVRNIFSLTKALEKYQMHVVTALDGNEALSHLKENPSIDIVLLDMMMPQMDGYETARKIRENFNWRNLPVIAVTAKAMTGDREKCIEAGASDYITKPVDIDQLLSLLRVWLYERS